jgi:MFS family permease
VTTHDRRNSIVLLGTVGFVLTSRMMWYQLLPVYLRNLGATDTQVGFVFTVSLLLGLAQLVGGFISDRWGRRLAIAWPTLLLVPGLALAANAAHWVALAGAMWWVSLLGSVQSPGFQALLAESAPDESRGRTFGAFYTVTGLGMIIGPALGTYLLDLPGVGLPALIWGSVAAYGVMGVIRLAFLREGHFSQTAGYRGTVSARALLAEPLYRRLLLISTLQLLVMSLTRDGPFVALHAADDLGMSEGAINLLFAAGGVGALVATLTGGHLADRFGGRAMAAVALAGHALALLAWVRLGGVGWRGHAIFVLSWMALHVGVVAYSAWQSAFAPPATRGRVLGMMGAFGTAASALGPQIGALLRQAYGSAAPFALSLGAVCVLGLMLLHMPGQHEIAPAEAITRPPQRPGPSEIS